MAILELRAVTRTHGTDETPVRALDASLAKESKYRASLPPGAPYVYSAQADQPGGLNSLRNAITSAFPVDTFVTVRDYSCSGPVPEGDYCSVFPWVPPDQRCFLEPLPEPHTEAQQRQALQDQRCDDISGRVREGEGVGMTVGDDGYLASVVQVSPEDLKRATKVLQAGGIVTQESRFVKNGRMTLTVQDTRKPHNGQDVPEEELPKVSAPEDRLCATLLTISAESARYAIIERGPRTPTDPRLLIAAVVAGLITLGATGIATGLAAADGRSDLTTLAAVGAAPSLRRRLSLAQAGVIAGIGSLLGAVAGGTASPAVLYADNQATVDTFPVVTPYPLAIAWSNVLPALAVPLVAMAGAGLLTRSRLPTERLAE